MNRFSAYASATIVSLLSGISGAETIAQSTLDRSLNQLNAEINMAVADAVASIDIAHEPMLTEQLQAIGDQLAQLDWQRLQDQPDLDHLFGFQKEKVIEKSYPINSKHRLAIDNRYGKIKVHNWNRNEAKVTIRVRTAESSEKRAQEALDRVYIDESKHGNDITFKTSISSGGGSNWWTSFTGGVSDRALQIDYEVFLPKGNELTLVNRYGAIELDDRDGKVAISVSYGSLSTGRLNSGDNSVAVAYSKAKIKYLNAADVSVRYGEFTLAEAETLTLALNYSSGSEVGRVNRTAEVSLRYSAGFKMGLGPSIKSAQVSAAYSNVEIQPASDAEFNFNVAVSYGGFNYDNRHISIDSRSESHTAKSYSGYWNKAVNNTVNINSRYGAVSLR